VESLAAAVSAAVPRQRHERTRERRRPLIVQSDKTLLLEVDHPLA
jgi:hypothetical protein